MPDDIIKATSDTIPIQDPLQLELLPEDDKIKVYEHANGFFIHNKNKVQRFIELYVNQYFNGELDMKQLAKLVGVSRATIYLWRRNPYIIGQMQRLTKADTPVDKLDIVAAIKRSAKEGDVRAQELWLRFVEQWNPAAKVELKAAVGVLTLSDLIEAEKAKNDTKPE